MCSNIIFTLIIFYLCIDIREVRLTATSDKSENNVNNANNVNKVPSNPNNPINSNVASTNITKSISKSTISPVVKPHDPEKVDEKQQPLHQIPANTNLQLTSDAFLRGFYVLIGFGVIVLIYLGIKTVRVNKPPTPNTTVRKYGVKARRGDLEMLPLPLDDEDDDDTVFEVGNQTRTEN